MSVLTGERGKLKVGYQIAASIGSWSVVRQQETLGATTVTVTAIITNVNGFYSQQRPLTIGLWMGSVWWVWRHIEIDYIAQGTTITAQLMGEPMAVAEY